MYPRKRRDGPLVGRRTGEQVLIFLLVIGPQIVQISCMSSKTDPLESLVVSQTEVATDAIASVLQGLVSIVKETGEVMPIAGFAGLDVNSKILAYLLGLRAAVILGLGRQMSATAEEVADTVGVDPQRAREYLSRAKRKFLLKTTDGWQLPVVRVSAACDELKKKRK
jgi:hypothetical protein